MAVKSRLGQIEAHLPAAVADAVDDAAERIAARAKATAPIESPPHGPPMELKESIDTRPARPSESARGGRGFRADVVAVWYWFLAEYGHEAGGPGPRGGVTGKAAPRPFMIPAAEAERAQFVAEVKNKLRGL